MGTLNGKLLFGTSSKLIYEGEGYNRSLRSGKKFGKRSQVVKMVESHTLVTQIV